MRSIAEVKRRRGAREDEAATVVTADPGERAGDGKAQSSAPSAGTRIGDLLVQAKLITRAQLSEALLQQASSGKRVGTILVEAGALDERDLTRVLSAQLDVPLADLSQERPKPDAIALLPETVARANAAVALSIEDGAVRVAVSDPTAGVDRILSAAIGQPVQLLVAPPSDIRYAIDTAYRALGLIEQHVSAFAATEVVRRPGDTTTQAVAEDAPVVHIVNLFVTQALRDRASDIHIEP